MKESMNRAEFIRQLECLLQSIPDAERQEALQYYNDYFDDAGDENEQDVIEALGNPARVAENIKRDLLESGYGETPVKKAVASDRKLIEYGEPEAQPQADPAPSQEPSADYGTLQNDSAAKTDSSQGTETNSGAGTDSFQGTGTNSGAGAGSSQGTRAGSAAKTDSSQGTETNNGVGTGSFQGTGTNSGAGLGSSQGTGTNSGSGMGNVSGFGSAMGSGAGNFSAGFGSGYGVGGGINGGSGYAYAGSGEVALKTVKSAKASKSGWPGWAVVLLVVGLVFASPVIIGVVGTLIGVLASWICLILAFGLVTLALFLVFLVLAVVGIMCMFTDPVCGIALIGGGLLCAGIGILFLMLTVAMAGIVTPAIIRGIAYLLGWRRKK